MNKELLTIEKSKQIQGILAIMIAVHHIYEKYLLSIDVKGTYYKWLMPLYDCSYIIIPIFMFIAGYSLYKQLKIRNKYLEGFLLKHIIPIYSINLITIVILNIIEVTSKGICNIHNIILEILLVKTFDGNDWFIVSIIILYAAFYISFKSYRNDWLSIIMLTIIELVYISVGLITSHGMYILQGEIWYNSVHLFIFGIIAAKFEYKTYDFINRNTIVKLLLAIAILVIDTVLTIKCEETFGFYGEYLGVENIIQRRIITLLFQQVTGIISVVTMLLSSKYIKGNNKVLLWIGKRALEIYLVHYSILVISKPEHLNLIKMVNYKTFTIISIIITVPLAYILSNIRVKIYNRINNILKTSEEK